MMSQGEAGELKHEQAKTTYGGYEGEQSYTHQQFETSYQQPLREERAEKLYVPAQDNNKNVLRLIAFGMALATLFAFAIICLIVVGGTAGWISFCAACLAVFIMTCVVIDKIK